MELPLRTGTVPSAKETLLKRSPTVTARGPTGTMAYCGKIWELFAVFRQGLRKIVHYPWGRGGGDSRWLSTPLGSEEPEKEWVLPLGDTSCLETAVLWICGP